MAKGQNSKAPRDASLERITEFEVSSEGTLWMAGFTEPETRAGAYEDIAGCCEGSPRDLADAMDDCQPLAWEVQSIYSDFRDEIVAELTAAENEEKSDRRKVKALRKRLEAMPEEPEEGASDWLLTLGSSDFERRIVPRIKDWLSQPPDRGNEDDYLPETANAQGAAMAFFCNMDRDARDQLGVEIVEGEHPASSYYAAELRGDIDEANRTAEAAGIPVRFVKAHRKSGH